MKIILLITVCKQNLPRIQNQLLCLDKHKELIKNYNIRPVFATADADLTVEGYDTIYLEGLEEKYTNLARKIVYSLKHVNENYEFDSLIKIDDDTLFNVDRLNLDIFKHDYVGRFYDHFTQNEIRINLPAYNLYETIKLYPSAYSDCKFSFASGDFYVLSKKAVNEVVNNIDVLEAFYKENVRISEDQFVGYCLRSSEITKLDYKHETNRTRQHVLQITTNITSVHPIINTMFASLLDKTPEQQVSSLLVSPSLSYRNILLEKLKLNIKNVIFDFVNSKKLSGMG